MNIFDRNKSYTNSMPDILYHELKRIASNPLFIKKLYLADKSFSYKYIRYRILRPVLKLYYKIFKTLHPNTPWTTPASIIFFKKYLTREMIGLEYGSGQSTIFFAKRLKELVSIEHNPVWYEKVKQKLAESAINNVDYFLIPENNPQNLSREAFGQYLDSLSGHEERPEFATYYNKVKDYPDNYFDFVLIDGRARVKCGLNAINKLKPGGIFVLDNSERPRYQPVHQALQSWPKVETTTGLTNTTFWFKP